MQILNILRQVDLVMHKQRDEQNSRFGSSDLTGSEAIELYFLDVLTNLVYRNEYIPGVALLACVQTLLIPCREVRSLVEEPHEGQITGFFFVHLP